MPKILVVFGSRSDSKVYDEIAGALKQKGISFDLKICSAHRTPELLDTLLKQDYKAIIAGAGLAAHLPGVIASKTIRPVIGVPIDSNFGGVDSLLSIVQMPSGIPVLGVGINNSKAASGLAESIISGGFREVAVIGDKDASPVKKCTEMLDTLGAKHSFSKKVERGKINLFFFSLKKEKPVYEKSKIIINAPLLEKSELEDAFDLVAKTKAGIFVGLNRGENAAIAAVEIMSINGRFDKKLNELRKGMKKAVISDNESVYKAK